MSFLCKVGWILLSIKLAIIPLLFMKMQVFLFQELIYKHKSNCCGSFCKYFFLFTNLYALMGTDHLVHYICTTKPTRKDLDQEKIFHLMWLGLKPQQFDGMGLKADVLIAQPLHPVMCIQTVNLLSFFQHNFLPFKFGKYAQFL